MIHEFWFRIFKIAKLMPGPSPSHAGQITWIHTRKCQSTYQSENYLTWKVRMKHYPRHYFRSSLFCFNISAPSVRMARPRPRQRGRTTSASWRNGGRLSGLWARAPRCCGCGRPGARTSPRWGWWSRGRPQGASTSLRPRQQRPR